MQIAKLCGFVGGVPERSKGADCKSAGSAFEGSNPSPSTTRETGTIAERRTRGVLGRRSRDQAGVAQWQSRSLPSLRRGFDSLHPLQMINSAARRAEQRRGEGRARAARQEWRRSRAERSAGPCSSVVEHSLGKGEVERSIRSMGTKVIDARKYTPTFARFS